MEMKAQEWESVIKDWQDSGLSQSEYCRRAGIKDSRFGYWWRKLKGKNEHSQQENKFISLIPEGKSERIEIHSGTISIKLPVTAISTCLKSVVECLR